MSSSWPKSAAGREVVSPPKSDRFIGGKATHALAFDQEQLLAGDWDDSKVIRSILRDSIKRCGTSRETIADGLSDLLGKKVTLSLLNEFTAESKNDRRWPAEWDRAFCKVTGDTSLIRRRAEMAGLHVADATERAFADLGRATLQRDRAVARIAELELQLEGVSL